MIAEPMEEAMPSLLPQSHQGFETYLAGLIFLIGLIFLVAWGSCRVDGLAIPKDKKVGCRCSTFAIHADNSQVSPRLHLISRLHG
jgi:hypothetical protein